jgi:hypothetical protein
MKRINILYWIFTALYAVVIIATSIGSIMSSPESIKFIVTLLGYPVYFLPFIGVAKVLGGIAILVPGFPRIKEWAYAGLTFDLIGAVYSFIAIGSPVSGWLPLLIFAAVLACSYIFYHKRLDTMAAAGVK